MSGMDKYKTTMAISTGIVLCLILIVGIFAKQNMRLDKAESKIEILRDTQHSTINKAQFPTADSIDRALRVLQHLTVYGPKHSTFITSKGDTIDVSLNKRHSLPGEQGYIHIIVGMVFKDKKLDKQK